MTLRQHCCHHRDKAVLGKEIIQPLVAALSSRKGRACWLDTHRELASSKRQTREPRVATTYAGHPTGSPPASSAFRQITANQRDFFYKVWNNRAGSESVWKGSKT